MVRARAREERLAARAALARSLTDLTRDKPAPGGLELVSGENCGRTHNKEPDAGGTPAVRNYVRNGGLNESTQHHVAQSAVVMVNR